MAPNWSGKSVIWGTLIWNANWLKSGALFEIPRPIEKTNRRSAPFGQCQNRPDGGPGRGPTSLSKGLRFLPCPLRYGGKVGPELTGSNRANLDYLLENMLDPGAVIPKEYTVTVLALSNGRLITGIVTQEVGERLTVVTANETLVIAKGDIESRRASDQSMMPDNLLQNLTQHEVRSLFGYLRHPSQTPILANLENLPLFFNGKDLTNWVGDPSLWSVKNEEIVGKSNGLKRTSSLSRKWISKISGWNSM